MAIECFINEFRWLSNFAPCHIFYGGLRFDTVEHAYQAAKTTDPRAKLQIQACVFPGYAKRMGKRVPMRGDWDEIKLSVMLDLVRQKFSDRSYKLLLLETGDQEIIEGNHWGDVYWGVCKGVGENHLGKIIMQVREEIRNAR